MPDNIPRSRGVPQEYTYDRGGLPAWQGLFVGVVKNNVDPTRSGALEVYIEQLGSGNDSDPSTWRKVNYCSPFYGITRQQSTSTGTGGAYNPQSYGMWFTPPDIGVRVICFFVGGDPSKGFYFGSVAEPGFNHMIPAIGSSSNYVVENASQQAYYGTASKLPVTEINEKNAGIANNPQFYNQPKPVHAVQAAILFQQGLINDTERGPISSNAQRETPSRVFGLSTPGRPIYAGGLTGEQIQQGLAENSITAEQAQIKGREGGHSLVLDDGDLTGKNNLVRIRSSKGHQVIMNDSAEFFYISHANGQTWIELGKEGTVDVFSTNSINLRSQGDVNIHADRDIRMYAKGNFYVNAEKEVKIASTGISQFTSEGRMTLATTSDLGLLASNSVSIKGKSGFFGVEKKLGLTGSKVLLNSGGVINVPPPVPIQKTKLNDTAFNSSRGWEIQRDALESIVTRAPTHEPYSYHGMGVGIQVALEPGTPSVPPGTQPMPPDWKITIT